MPDIERRQRITQATARAKFYAGAGVLLSIVTVIVVATLAVLQPNNPAVLITITSITMPIITALIAAGLRGNSIGVDGQLNRLFQAIAEKEHAKGVVEGIEKAKNGG